MYEKQRRDLERELSIARGAIWRAHLIAERGAYYAYEDCLHDINRELAALIDAVISGRERVSLPPRISA